MPALSITLPQMVDLALATPDLGGLNLNVIHALLQIIVKRLNLSQCRVEFRGPRSSIVESMVTRMPKEPLVQVEEFELDSSDETKRSAVKKPIPRTTNLFIVKHFESIAGEEMVLPPGFPLQPVRLFTESDSPKVCSETEISVHDIVAPVLPRSKDLLHEADGNENAIFDMFKLLNLEKRLEAVEAALRNINDKNIFAKPVEVGPQPADTGSQPADTSHQPADAAHQPADAAHQPADAAHQPADAGPQPANTGHQPADTGHQPADTVRQPADPDYQSADPDRQSADVGPQPIYESNEHASITQIMERMCALEEAVAAINKNKETFLADEKIHVGGLSVNSNDTARLSCGQIGLPLDPSQEMKQPETGLSMVNEEVINKMYDEIFARMCEDESVMLKCKLFERLQNSIQDMMKAEMQELQNKIENIGKRPVQSGHSEEEKERLNDDYRNKWFGNCPDNGNDIDHLFSSNNREENLAEIKRFILSDKCFINVLSEKLASRFSCAENFAKLTDISELKICISHLEQSQKQLDEKIPPEGFLLCSRTLEKALEDVKHVGDDLVSFQLEFKETMHEIQDMMDAKLDKCHIPAIKEYIVSQIDDMKLRLKEILNKKLTPDCAIGCFNFAADLKCVSCNTEACMKDKSYSAPIPKYPKLQESKVLQAAEKNLCLEPPLHRYCGGRHTVTTPQGRLWQAGHFLDQFSVYPPSTDVTLVEGANGHMYRVDPPKSDCVCFELKAEEINRCKKQN